MDFSTSDFSKLRYRVDLISDYSQNLTDIFPDLKKYDAFKLTLDIALNQIKIFKYIVLMYDKNSPLLVIENIEKRKTQAAILSDFDKNNGEIIKQYIDTLNGLNVFVNTQISTYWLFMDDEAFANMCLYKEMLYKEREQLLTTSDAEDRLKINKNIQTFTSFYEDCKKKFQQGDISTLGLNEEVRLGIEQEEIPSPETIAYALRAGIDPTIQWTPYDKHYIPELTMGNVRHIYKSGDEIPPLKKKK